MASPAQFRFHSSCGAGIELRENNTTATRGEGEGEGWIVLSNAPITPGVIYEVKASNYRIQVGICDWNPDEEVPRSSLPDSAENIPGRMAGMDNGWRKAVVCDVEKGLAFPIGMEGTDSSSFTGDLGSDRKIGVMLDKYRRFHLYVNGHDKGVVDGQDKGVFATCLPELKWYAFWDLGTSCQWVTAQ